MKFLIILAALTSLNGTSLGTAPVAAAAIPTRWCSFNEAPPRPGAPPRNSVEWVQRLVRDMPAIVRVRVRGIQLAHRPEFPDSLGEDDTVFLDVVERLKVQVGDSVPATLAVRGSLAVGDF